VGGQQTICAVARTATSARCSVVCQGLDGTGFKAALVFYDATAAVSHYTYHTLRLVMSHTTLLLLLIILAAAIPMSAARSQCEGVFRHSYVDTGTGSSGVGGPGLQPQQALQEDHCPSVVQGCPQGPPLPFIRGAGSYPGVGAA